MHEEPLSRAEIQSLLGNLVPADEGLECGDAEKGGANSGADAQAIAGLRRIHEEFCRGLAAAWSELVRSEVAATVIDARQASWRAATTRVSAAACQAVWEAEPIGCPIAAVISPAILYPLLDRLLGGRARSTSPLPQRPMTEIEIRLARHLVQPLAIELQKAWRDLVPLALRGERIESNCQRAPTANPEDMLVVIACDVVLEECRGPVQIWIPRAAIEPQARRLAAISTLGPSATTPGQGALLELAADLAETTMTIEQLLNLKVGDIIPTSQPTSGPVLVTVEGLPKFHGRVGQHQGRLAVRIERRIALDSAADADTPQPSQDS